MPKRLTGAAAIDFTYLEQPPNRYTFQIPLLKQWTEKWCKGLVLNLFAGKTLLNCNEVRVDLDPKMPSHYNMEANDFIGSYNGKPFDTVIFDPPYNLRKSREKYEGRYIGKLTILKDKLLSVIKRDAYFISYGYDSVGMGTKRGFKKIAICLICHFGDHNDTIALVEKYVQPTLLGGTSLESHHHGLGSRPDTYPVGK